jgi:broad specificity phosphatase PhoE
MLVAMFWQGHIDVELNEVGREQAAVVRYQFVFHVGFISISVSCSHVGKFLF